MAGVGTMNVGVARNARLVLRGMDLLNGNITLRARVERGHMAEEADGIDIGPAQKVHIRAAVRQMTGCASFGFDDRMFKYEWAGNLRMAIGADLILLL